ncbi:MAG: GAF domain-containing protein [Actinomycetes bacterium]
MHTQQIQEQRWLSTAVAQFAEALASLTPSEILRDGLDLIRQECRSDLVTLSSTRNHVVTNLGASPSWAVLESPVSADWFPWGLGMVQPQRFLFLQRAELLPADPMNSRTLGDRGVCSSLHLPILERQQPIGALQIYWSTPRQDWDDHQGRILRSIGRLLLRGSIRAH